MKSLRIILMASTFMVASIPNLWNIYTYSITKGYLENGLSRYQIEREGKAFFGEFLWELGTIGERIAYFYNDQVEITYNILRDIKESV